jgi:hypothetical protein
VRMCHRQHGSMEAGQPVRSPSGPKFRISDNRSGAEYQPTIIAPTKLFTSQFFSRSTACQEWRARRCPARRPVWITIAA